MVRSFVIAISECLVGVSSESSQVRANACVCVCVCVVVKAKCIYTTQLYY